MRASLSALVLLWSSLAHAVIVPDDYPSIQAAIDASSFSVTIQVRPGTYAEALVIGEKALAIEGLGGQPVIAPGSTAKAVSANGGGNFNTVLILRDIVIDGARVGVMANMEEIVFERVTISSCIKGAILTSTRLDLVDTTVSGNGSFGLRALARGPQILRLTASNNAGMGAKIKNVRRRSLTSTGLLQDSAFDNNGKFGLVYVDDHSDNDTFSSNISGCEASQNGKAGIRVLAKAIFVALSNNQADGNGTYGFDLRGAVPDQADLVANGNSAAGNALQDFHVVQQ